jgi:Ca-activated chloride channel family protein
MRARLISVVGCSLLGVACGGGHFATAMRSPDAKYAPAYAPPPAEPSASTEQYTDYGVTPFVDTSKDKLSTFAVDVDTASYSISRRKLREGAIPPKAAVRAEEFINSFDYGYPGPTHGSNAPFAVHFAASPSPFEQGHHLVRIGIKGKHVQGAERAAVHLVYLVDTSGSMNSADKLGLAKKSLHLLTDTLKAGDTIALCTYAGSVREVLAPTGMNDKPKIHAAIDDLSASGSTAMSSGIDLAYALAKKTLVKGHVNRVVVLSDGDANVGPSSHDQLLKQIEQYRNEGITLSTVGFGDGNYKDTMMEQLADKGDGNYSYIDDEKQARKVFVDQIDGLLQVIARDVKVQVEFDPELVEKYRLIGYDNREVKDKDFRNDKVDGGEIGAGHSVTAIYDVVLKKTGGTPLTVRIRHKKPLGSDPSTENAYPMAATQFGKSFEAADANFRLAVAVMSFAEILRESPHAKEWTLGKVESIAKGTSIIPAEQTGLLELIGRAKTLSPKS